MAKQDPADSRVKLADKIIKEYDKVRASNRKAIEDEVRRIANPLSMSDIESDVNEYVGEDDMFDTTVRQAAVIANNGIMSRMFPPSSKWFANTFKKKDESENEERHIRALETVGDLQFRQLGQDNFYGAMSEALNDYLHLGTTNIRLTKGKRRFAHFQAIPKSTYQFQLDDEGFPDIVWNYYKLTAYELKTRFGDGALPERIKLAVDEEKWDEKFEVINKIERRTEFSDAFPSPPDKREYSSIWVSKGDKDIIGNSSVPRRKVIYEDGEYYNLYTIGRLMTRAGQAEGDGLTTMMLPAIRTANQKAINIEKAQNLAVDPAWWHDESNPLDEILPGGRVPMDSFDPASRATPIPMPSDGIQWEQAGLAEIRNDIKEAFFVSAFKMFTNMDVATNRKTAFEARLIKSEQLSLLITLLYNLSEEIVKPLLEKHLGLMIRSGKIPQGVLDDLPDNYEIELTSQFAKSIESSRAEDLMSASEMAIQLEQVSPGITRSTVKTNQAFRKVLLNMEIDVDDLYTSEESDELMQQEQEMQQAMQTAQIANQGADAMAKMQQ
jgi:hypothetical protein